MSPLSASLVNKVLVLTVSNILRLIVEVTIIKKFGMGSQRFRINDIFQIFTNFAESVQVISILVMTCIWLP